MITLTGKMYYCILALCEFDRRQLTLLLIHFPFLHVRKHDQKETAGQEIVGPNALSSRVKEIVQFRARRRHRDLRLENSQKIERKAVEKALISQEEILLIMSILW